MLTSFNLISQTDETLGLHSEGGPWQFYPSLQENDSLPRVLLIGDSVMNGFHSSLIQSLNGLFVKGVIKQALQIIGNLD